MPWVEDGVKKSRCAMCGRKRRLQPFPLSRENHIRVCWECHNTNGLRSIALRLAPKLRALEKAAEPYRRAQAEVKPLLETWRYARLASQPFPDEPEGWGS